jgi:hypothetical protein
MLTGKCFHAIEGGLVVLLVLYLMQSELPVSVDEARVSQSG